MSFPTPPPEDNPFAPPPEGGVPTPPEPAQAPPPPPPAPPAYAAPPPPPPAPAYGTPPPPPPAYPAPSYGAPAYGAPAPASVPNNMPMAIAALVLGLCCSGIIGLATGIVALVFASQVNNKAAVGDIAGATDSARKARLFSIITFVIAALSVVAVIILFSLGAFSSSTKVN